MRFVAVFDTNVLLSAVGWKGNPFHCLELARAGTVEVVTCPEILDELTEDRSLTVAVQIFTASESVDDFAAVSSRTSAMRAAMSDSAVSQEHMKRAPPAPMNV